MATATSYHVAFDEHGVAWIDDSNVKVIEVVLDHIAHGLSPDEIHHQHYRSLSLAQIHAALVHYYDHQPQFDAEIERQVRQFETLRSAALDSPGRRRLRAQGIIVRDH